jgi:hypothetical protein
MLRAFHQELASYKVQEQLRSAQVQEQVEAQLQAMLDDVHEKHRQEQRVAQEGIRLLMEEVQELRKLKSGRVNREEVVRLMPGPEATSIPKDNDRKPDRAIRMQFGEIMQDLPSLEISRLDPLARVSARDFRPGEQLVSGPQQRENADLRVRTQFFGEFRSDQEFDRGWGAQGGSDHRRLDGSYGAHEPHEVKPEGWKTEQNLHAPAFSRASDRAWKAAQAECDKATTVAIRPSANLWDATWNTLNSTVLGPVVASVLQSQGQEWNLVLCLTDNVTLIMASMLGWAVPFPSKSGTLQTPAGQWNEAFLRLQNKSLDQDEHVMASAQHYLGSQGVADDTLLYNKVLRKIKAAQGSVVQMILNLTNDATPLPKLGMRTTRQHVERAAQTAAYGKEVQVTPHLVFVVIMECAKQGKKDAARIRKEAMQQLLGTKICKDPQTLLGNLQTFEDLKTSYETEFAVHLPEDFEEDLLRQQQENAKGSDNADMRALLRSFIAW